MAIAKGWSVEAMVFRMVSAFLMGTIIGVERGIKRRGAGVKTHVLVRASDDDRGIYLFEF